MAKIMDKRGNGRQKPIQRLAVERVGKDGKPIDRLTAKVLAAEAAGYGCHYGQFVADHPDAFKDWDGQQIPKIDPDRYERVCPNCGKTFISTKKGLPIYCNIHCQQDMNRKRTLAKYHEQKAKEDANNGND